MKIKVLQNDWIAHCDKCKGLILGRGIKIPSSFTCWNCGTYDIRLEPGADIFVLGEDS